MKKLCLPGTVLWISWILSVISYGEKERWIFFQTIPEIVLLLIFLYLIRASQNKWKHIGQSIIFLLCIIYFIQCIYYSQVGEFMSILALENADQAYLLIRPAYIICLLVIIVVSFLIVQGSKVFLSKNKLIISMVCIVLSVGGVYIQNTNSHRGGTPIASLSKNIVKSIIPFTKQQKKIAGYPFEKEWIYKNSLPFPAKSDKQVEQPNIIIIFTEGTSARLLDCYNGKLGDVTPNIDAFSEKSMVVDRYYNHTAATFRGTHGQLTSCYPRYGGYEKGGWVGNKSGAGVSKQLAKREYQSLPKLLNVRGYDTSFISPHMQEDPYTDLLNMLGFHQVYTRDSSTEFLPYNPEFWHSSLTDQDMYTELVQILEHKTTSQPFLIAMYTFETHTNVDTPDDGIKYKDGSNETLNTLHNVDNAFGMFWNYFMHSQYKDNTIIIFTADHCHYHDKPFMSLVANDTDYVKCFHDRIPLIIYDPLHSLPERYDAQNNTSLALTPTICQILGINNEKNSFLGSSIFEPLDTAPVLAAGPDFYSIEDNHVVRPDQLSENDKKVVQQQIEKIMLFYECEKANRVFH
jgi:hypothetical protein